MPGIPISARILGATVCDLNLAFVRGGGLEVGCRYAVVYVSTTYGWPFVYAAVIEVEVAETLPKSKEGMGDTPDNFAIW